LLPPLLTAFHERHPLVHLEVQVAPGEMLLHALAEHAIALVLIEEQQRRRGWEYHLLGNEGLTLLAPCTHPLLQQEQVSAGELREYPLIVPCPGSPLRRTLEDALRKRGLPMSDWQIVLECDSITMITQAVRNALGLAFVPDMHLAMVPGIERVNLSGTPLHQEWYILRERGHHFPRAAQELFLFLTSAITSTILQRCGLSIPENMKER
jgi:DNA-binding transcriptional LysR family regulator